MANMKQFNIEELNKVLGFIDLAVRAGGYSVAEQAFPIVAKMRELAGELPAPPSPPNEDTHEGAE